MYVDESVLDDVGRLEAADAPGLLPHTASAARQVRQSWSLAGEAGVDALAADGRPRAIVVVGVDAAALAADVLATVAGPAAPVPVIGHHHHGLPGWVGVADVVLAVSTSGTSAETRSAAEEAYRRGCRLAVVSPPDTPLAHLAGRAHAPFVAVTDARPGRTALWSLAVPLLAACRSLGVLREADAAIEAAAVRLEEMATRCRPSSESFVNPAKTLALEMTGSLPLFWGTTPLTATAAGRAVDVLAAHARYPALAGALPHPAHNQVALFDGVFGAGAASGAGDGLEDFFRDRGDEETTVRMRLILLRDPGAEHSEVTREAEAAVAAVAERGLGVTELRTDGAGPLERLASLIGLVDFASVYLAVALGVDLGQGRTPRDLGRAR